MAKYFAAGISLACSPIAIAGAHGQDADAGGYKVVSHFKLSGAGPVTAVAVASDARRIYVADGAGIEIVDADSGGSAGAIGIAGGAGGVVVVPALKRGFATDHDRGTVVTFDLDSGKILSTTSSDGKAPGAILYDDATGRLFVSNEGTGSVAAIDAASGKLVGSARIEGRPGQLAVNPYGSLYVAMPGTNRIGVVGTAAVNYEGTFPAGSGTDCSGLALDPIGRRLFASCANGQIAVIDTDTGFTFENLDGGKGASNAAFVSRPDGKAGWKGAAFISSADGQLTAVQMQAFIRYVVGDRVTLKPGIGPVAFDAKSHHLVVAAPADGGQPELLVLSH